MGSNSNEYFDDFSARSTCLLSHSLIFQILLLEIQETKIDLPEQQTICDPRTAGEVQGKINVKCFVYLNY